MAVKSLGFTVYSGRSLAMATEVPHARVWGVEVSPRAFVWTKKNFSSVGADNARAVFIDLAGNVVGTRPGAQPQP